MSVAAQGRIDPQSASLALTLPSVGKAGESLGPGQWKR